MRRERKSRFGLGLFLGTALTGIVSVGAPSLFATVNHPPEPSAPLFGCKNLFARAEQTIRMLENDFQQANTGDTTNPSDVTALQGIYQRTVSLRDANGEVTGGVCGTELSGRFSAAALNMLEAINTQQSYVAANNEKRRGQEAAPFGCAAIIARGEKVLAELNERFSTTNVLDEEGNPTDVLTLVQIYKENRRWVDSLSQIAGNSCGANGTRITHAFDSAALDMRDQLDVLAHIMATRKQAPANGRFIPGSRL